jgi:hypothetical protein
MDFSKLSDDEINALVAEKQKKLNPIDSFASMSDDELNQLVSSKQRNKKEKFIQEMPEALSWKDRAIVKNFSNNSKDAAVFLQEKYPDHDVTVNDRGGLYMRKRGDRDWKAVDPDTGFFSKDFLNDVTDIGFDTIAGVGTSAATAAGGLAGAGAGGIGALPAAAAAGAASSGGLETLRQSLGKALGIKQDYDAANIGMSAGFGAVSPLVFGTGATQKQLLQKALASNLDDAGIEALKKSQQGAAGKLYDWAAKKALPWTVGKAGGYQTKDLQDLPKYLSRIEAVEGKGVEGMMGYVDEATDDYIGSVRQQVTQTGKELQEAYSKEGLKVPMMAANERMLGLRNEILEEIAKNPTDNNQAKLEAWEQVYENLFMQNKKVAEKVTKQVPTGLLDAAGKPITTAVEETVEKSVKVPMVGLMDADAAFSLKKDLADAAGLSKIEGGLVSRYSKAAPIEKQLKGVLSLAAEDVDKELVKAAPDSKVLKDKLRQYFEDTKALNRYVSKPEAALKTLQTLDSPQKAITLARIRRTPGGRALEEKARVLSLGKKFSPQLSEVMSSGGATSTSRTIPLQAAGAMVGGYAGYKLGNELGGPGSGFAGAGLGSLIAGTLGSKFFSPAAIRAGLKAGMTAEEVMRATQRAGGRALQAAPASAWNYMRDEK